MSNENCFELENPHKKIGNEGEAPLENAQQAPMK
jgi:hypothetical protein